MPIKKVIIDVRGGDTVPDPVRVHQGDVIEWSINKPWKFVVSITKWPGGGSLDNPFAGAHPWQSGNNGKAMTGAVKRGKSGGYYKTTIVVTDEAGNTIDIDPHFIVDY